MAKPQAYPGKEISVVFDGRRCVHSRNCVLGLPQVFRANVSGPWIVPDNAPAEMLAALVRTCPSGALSYQRHDSGTQEAAPMVNVIRVLENGPLACHADLHIGDLEPVYRATLCRCGASGNKPFCDGSHREAGFTASGEPPTRESGPLAARDGVLTVSPVRDGPLMVEGNIDICAGTGRAVVRAQNAALCRCGASSNKPFCDGSHVAAKFRAD